MKILSAFLSLLLLCSCFSQARLEPSFRSEDITTPTGDLVPPPNFAQFKDIPIPEKSVMNLKQTLLFGQDPIVGRLTFNAPYNPTNVFDFYMVEMPKFGWTAVAMTRSQHSVLTFSRDNRVAIVQISATSMGGTQVVFDISLSRQRKDI